MIILTRHCPVVQVFSNCLLQIAVNWVLVKSCRQIFLKIMVDLISWKHQQQKIAQDLLTKTQIQDFTEVKNVKTMYVYSGSAPIRIMLVQCHSTRNKQIKHNWLTCLRNPDRQESTRKLFTKWDKLKLPKTNSAWPKQDLQLSQPPTSYTFTSSEHTYPFNKIF